jgi:hypothetical protein
VRWTPLRHARAQRRHDAARLRAGEFTFLNRSERLGWPPRWSDAALPLLWIYNLHYFEFLESLAVRGRPAR